LKKVGWMGALESSSGFVLIFKNEKIIEEKFQE
jgi:hypothetical protein